MQLPRMDAASAGEILRLCRYFLQDHSTAILADYASELEVSSAPPAPTIFDMLGMPEYHDAISMVQDDTKESQEIVEVYRKGYQVGDSYSDYLLFYTTQGGLKKFRLA